MRARRAGLTIGSVILLLLVLILVAANTWLGSGALAPHTGFLLRWMKGETEQQLRLALIFVSLVLPPVLLGLKAAPFRANKAWTAILTLAWNGPILIGLLWLSKHGAGGPVPPSLSPTVPRVIATSRDLRRLCLQSNAPSSDPRVSRNGRVVVYLSAATNLAEGANNGKTNVYVYDRATGHTLRLTASFGGRDYDCARPDISDDGHVVAYTTAETDSLSPCLFIHDLSTGKSATYGSSPDGTFTGPQGARANGKVRFSRPIFQDRNLVFWAENMVCDNPRAGWALYSLSGLQDQRCRLLVADLDVPRPSDYDVDASRVALEAEDGGKSVILLKDLRNQTSYRASVSSSATPADAPCNRPDLSGSDGVAFESEAANLVSDDHNSLRDIFYHQRSTGKTVRISQSAAGGDANGASSRPSSDQRRLVAFESAATNLVSSNPPTDEWKASKSNIFLRFLETSPTTLVSASYLDPKLPGNGPSSQPCAGGDDYRYSRRYDRRPLVAYRSEADNLVPNDTNRQADIFLWTESNRTNRNYLVSARYYEELDSKLPATAPQQTYLRFVQAARQRNMSAAGSCWSRARNVQFPASTGDRELLTPQSFVFEAVEEQGDRATLVISEFHFDQNWPHRSKRLSKYALIKEDGAWKLDSRSGALESVEDKLPEEEL